MFDTFQDGSLELDLATEALKQGRAAIFPTDTLYGLGLSVRHAAGPGLLYQLKHRDAGKPIAWLVADETALDTFGADVPAYAHALAHAFWPGGLTLIVKAGPTVPEAFRAEAGTIGLRCPDDPTALALIERVGGPLATTSANLSGHSASRTFSAIDSELLSQVPYAIEDDVEKSGIASTIVDCTGDVPTILREGAIDLPAIEAVIAG